jgi:hypothetical protein
MVGLQSLEMLRDIRRLPGDTFSGQRPLGTTGILPMFGGTQRQGYPSVCQHCSLPFLGCRPVLGKCEAGVTAFMGCSVPPPRRPLTG